MTRTIFRNVPCPGCGRVYAIGFFASVNLSGWKQWPDGWGYGDLHHLQTELRGCSCGALFWPKGSWFQTNETDLSVITEPDAEPEPEPDEEPEPTPKGWFARWRSKKPKQDSLTDILNRVEDQWPKIPVIHPVSNMAGLYRVLCDGSVTLDHATELEIRKWLWWTWNHPSRGLDFVPGDVGLDVSEEEKEANLVRAKNLSFKNIINN